MQAFITSLTSVVELLLVIALGYWLRTSGKLGDQFKGNISYLIMNIALPASIFVSVLKYLNRQKLFGLTGGLIYAIICFALSYLFAWILCKLLRIRKGRRGTFINAITNANTIFIGLPLNIALFGQKSMPYFLIYYVLNTVSTWAIGVFFISSDDPTAQKNKQQKFNWKKLLPAPLVGFLIALICLLVEVPIPGWITAVLSMVGGIVTPMSLIYIGIILADAGLKSIHLDRDTIWALLGRFILVPALMIILIVVGANWLPALTGLAKQTLVVQSATPALAVLPILVGESHGDVQYATNVVTTSTVLFVIVVPLVLEITQILI